MRFNTTTTSILILIFVVSTLSGCDGGLLNYNKKSDANSTTVTNERDKQSSSNSNEDLNSTKSEAFSNKCSICGRSFAGNGYCQSDGIWRPCDENNISSICSIICGKRANGELDNAVDNLLNKNNDGRLCTNCGLGHYRNGFCDYCGAASSGKVGEHSQMHKCSLCHGTGIEKPTNNIFGDEGRVCPLCNGTGMSD